MSNVDFLGKAVEIVNKAISEDTNGNLKEAYRLYMQSLDWFITCLKYEKNERVRESIKKKLEEYIGRAEQLKEHISKEEKQVVPSSGPPVSKKGKNRSESNSNETDSENKKLRAGLEGSIITEKPNVSWNDVAGLEGAKEALKEAVILPIKFPQLFTGTGKSYLAKAVATEAKSTFFAVSSSDLVSKWMGESERLVKNLFSMARENSPAIIFIDEVDSLCGTRGEGESEASRRIKTELLVQMNGIGNDDTGVLVLAATNIPWALDSAIRRRFEKRIYIPLPDLNARQAMFKIHVGDTRCNLSQSDYRMLAEKTDGYSGSDIAVIVRDALMQPVRMVQTATHFKRVRGNYDSDKDNSSGDSNKWYWTPCSPGDPDAVEKNWTGLESDDLYEPELTLKYFLKSLQSIKPTVNASDLHKQTEFTAEFGQEG
ncbi:hypothetical protein BB560_002855 [Smittium megazygosporum]|uniref:vesicle-fusing ATPase n=1 Tax=Smittium megazygosporum TaxID=133381 RepID=A0A2T9ZDM5_9FUNG|nr:hypothetical protein BB560_002855 [Smittium megazygosporum]